MSRGQPILRVLLAAGWFTWTAAVIPGHTRGAITIPGSHALCHEAATGDCCGTPGHDPRPARKAPTPSDRANCAICHLAVRLSLPPAIELTPTPQAPLHLLPVAAPSAPELAPVQPPYYPCGPPDRAA